MEIKEGWVVVIAIVAFIAGCIFTGAAIADSITSDCASLGKFSWHGNAYQCSPVGKPTDGAK